MLNALAVLVIMLGALLVLFSAPFGPLSGGTIRRWAGWTILAGALVPVVGRAPWALLHMLRDRLGVLALLALATGVSATAWGVLEMLAPRTTSGRNGFVNYRKTGKVPAEDDAPPVGNAFSSQADVDGSGEQP
jgi:hypothetical protein